MYRVIRHMLIIVMLFAAIASNSHAKDFNIRPIEDFLDAQGQTSMFVPPIPDYAGWVDADFVTFALIDYAGLANAFIETKSNGKISLETCVDGTVIEHAQPDGRIKVSVRLFTSNALAWAFLIADWCEKCKYPFRDTPLAFGARAQDVLKGANPALAETFFHVTFMREEEEDLPDLVQLLNNPEPEQLPYKLKFNAYAEGKDAQGRPAVLRVEQICKDTGEGQTCSKEVVEIQVLEEED